MHKKLAADLTSLAHSILQMKNKEDVFALKTKAHEVYEKLSVLAYVEEYLKNTPNPEYTKDELLDLVEKAEKKSNKETQVNDQEQPEDQQLTESEDEVIETVEEEFVNEGIELTIEDTSNISDVQEEVDDLFSQSDETTGELIEHEPETVEVSEEETMLTLEDELKDTIAADVVADLFENAPKNH